MFDLPPFSKDGSMKYALNLLAAFWKSEDNLADYFNVPKEGIADCLEGVFW